MKEKIKTITNILDGYLNGGVSFSESKKKLTSVFSARSFSEFLESIQDNSIKITNQILVITVLGYLLYKDDSESKIVNVIYEKNLEKVYFGGIKKLLLGRSKLFSAKTSIDDSGFDNKLRFIGTYDPDYYKSHLLFSACKILCDLSQEDFEKIIIEEGAIYYLWAVYLGHIDYKPSEIFLKKLINSDNELQRSISFLIAVQPIELYINDKTNDEIDEGKLNELLDDFYSVLDYAEASNIVSLLLNYLLINKIYPTDFILKLTQDEYVDILCNLIAKTNTIKLVQELANLSSGIFEYSKENNDKTNKAIVDCLEKLFDNSSLSFDYENNKKYYVDSILKGLSESALNSLKDYFVEYDKGLMLSELDSMVRYKIYHMDIQKHKCIISILNSINKLIYNN